MQAIPEIIYVEPVGGLRLRLRFTDGEEGEVDLSSYLNYGPVFRPLADEVFFRQVTTEGGTISWPNGADIAPERLYEMISQHRIIL